MPPASTTRTTGCCTQGVPAVTAVGGGTARTSLAGGPGATAKHLEVKLGEEIRWGRFVEHTRGHVPLVPRAGGCWVALLLLLFEGAAGVAAPTPWKSSAYDAPAASTESPSHFASPLGSSGAVAQGTGKPCSSSLGLKAAAALVEAPRAASPGQPNRRETLRKALLQPPAGTLLPPASTRATTGWGAKATPPTVSPGCTEMARRAGAPFAT